MIFDFFSFLKNEHIDFALINGYKDIVNQKESDSDIDILFKQCAFVRIEEIVQKFCMIKNIQIVQILHHDLWAKNIFLFDHSSGSFLNLDLYGVLSRKKIIFFSENKIFNQLDLYDDIPILSFDQEFIYYLIKKLDKNSLTENNFEHLKYLYKKNNEVCNKVIHKFFLKHHAIVSAAFSNGAYGDIVKNRAILVNDFSELKSFDMKYYILNKLRFIKRIMNPTGLTVSFLGPDGSGKSTIIDLIVTNQLPFRRKDYFHLKPISSKPQSDDKIIVTDPHKFPPYSKRKSYIKLLYFIGQYNIGWLKNILPLKVKSSLVIFDRYFDDLLVDHRRYRYGGGLIIAKLARIFIPKPNIYFILTTDAKVIYKRKQEVPFEELQRQIKGYESMADGKRYFKIDVDRTPEEITKEIITIMMEKMNERY